MTKRQENTVIPVRKIEQNILLLRDEKVMLDSALADLYGVETGYLIRAVKRNIDRFPSDFMFQLSDEEWNSLRCQFGTSNVGRGGRRYLPYAFTEQGVAMLSSVLRSQQAVEVNVEIMRTFVRLRRMLIEHEELSQKLADLEEKYDAQFKTVFEAIHQLMVPPEPQKKRPIGVVRKEQE